MKAGAEQHMLKACCASRLLGGPVIVAMISVLLLSGGWRSAGAADIPEVPLVTTQAAPPMTMLVMGRDHTLYYEAYNDASDLDGDGVIDTRFRPTLTYFGLFDSGLCYKTSAPGEHGRFVPVAEANDGKCRNAWSGNWLNYVTTSRIDALRKVLYGGRRVVDTEHETVLERSYIPQDAHSWGKEYESEAVDGYAIEDYTPLAAPTYGTRHLFANTSLSWAKSWPRLRVLQHSTFKVREWVSKESLVAGDTCGVGVETSCGVITDYAVRVEVCRSPYTASCKRYPSGFYKPVGLLHDYGESESMYFGLLTGSYDKHYSGGVIRKLVSSFKDEVDARDGTFRSGAAIVRSLDALQIVDFGWNAYGGGWPREAKPSEGTFPDWGNPIAEMMYEGLRYFAGALSPTPDYAGGSRDGALGLPKPAWDDPYSASGASKGLWCSKANMLVISSVNPSFDSDQLPGSAFSSFSGTGLPGLNVSSLGGYIAGRESGVRGLRFIGQVGELNDGAPTPKAVDSLGNIRGLPEEPNKQGSYYAASVAHFGKATDLRPALRGRQSVDTFVVALSSPLPRIEVPVAGGSVTIVPFAKTVSVNGGVRGSFQPTNQIVDFYVEDIVNTSDADRNWSVNGGRYRAIFSINFEDVEMGADHDMDAIVRYTVSLTAAGQVEVKLDTVYATTSGEQHAGYVISGTTADGIYLDVNPFIHSTNVHGNGQAGRKYFLDTPPGCWLSADGSRPAVPACDALLGTSAARAFTPGSSSAGYLEGPLWYAAKWGGFIDRNGNGWPDLRTEWDLNGDGVPDTYLAVQNPLKLREALKRSFDSIVERSASAGNVTANGQQLQAGSLVFQAHFNSGQWDGELTAYPLTSSGVSPMPAWRASAGIPAPDARRVYTYSALTGGVRFRSPFATMADGIVNYLLGDRSAEGTLRTRGSSVLGDIVHSSPYYVKDTDTVYVGANDGMLHGFSAVTGKELFAYIPGLVFDKLERLAAPDYAHTYYVDGEIAVSTRAVTPGRNILAASPGRGAKGLFVLDVTNPSAFTADNVLWEYGGDGDGDLGFILGRPQIATLEDDRVVVVVGNGYGSANGAAVLYVFDLMSGDRLAKLNTFAAGGNGLSTPVLVDGDGNGKVDTAYAGDLRGNVWRFDLADSDPLNWRSHYRESEAPSAMPRPLFTARDALGAAQPITAQLTVAINSVVADPNHGRTFVFFGTGSYLFASDPGSRQVQSWYGIIVDEEDSVSGRAQLVKREFERVDVLNGTTVRVAMEAEEGDMLGKRGWYLDLKDSSIPRGERIVTRSALYHLIRPVLVASSIIPSADECEPGGSGYINALDPFTGGRLTQVVFDLNGDGRFDDRDRLDGMVVSSFDPGLGLPSEGTLVGNRYVAGGTSGENQDWSVNLGSRRLGRISWREVIRE